MKKFIIIALLAISIFSMFSHAQARGRVGSHRIGGYTSTGKGSHYIGGYTRIGPALHPRSSGGSYRR